MQGITEKVKPSLPNVLCKKQKNINIFKCQDLIINKVGQVVTDGAGKGPDWPGCRWASGVAGKVLILELWWWLQRHLPWNNSLSHPSVCFCIYVSLKKIFKEWWARM